MYKHEYCKYLVLKNPCFLALYKMYVRTFKTTWEVYEEEIENKDPFSLTKSLLDPID